MQDNMNLSINGQSQVPPGFRFHPTEEELLHYYLRKKVSYEKIDLDVIREVDLNKLEPWDIQEKCKIGSTPQNDWYFFSHKDKKYPTGTRTNRATAAGFWKATGRDKIIYSGSKRIGLRKTLVFYKGRAPRGQKSDWIMHEYRLDENNSDHTNASSSMGESVGEEGWVVCRVFRKKNYQKTLDSPKSSSTSTDVMKSEMLSSNNVVLDQILHSVGKTCKAELSNESFNNSTMHISNRDIRDVLQDRFMHLPRLESPTLPSINLVNSTTSSSSSPFVPKSNCHQSSVLLDDMLTEPYAHQPCLVSRGISGCDLTSASDNYKNGSGFNDWVTFDRLVASQLNGQVDTTASRQFSCISTTDPNAIFSLCPTGEGDDEDAQLSQMLLHPPAHRSNQDNSSQLYGNTENDLWSFTKLSSSSSDPLCHLSV